MPAKKTYQEIKQRFADQGYILLSGEYQHAHQKLDFLCPDGHIHAIAWNDFRRGSRCALCLNRVRPSLHPKIDIEIVQAAFQAENWTLLSSEYKNAHTKLNYCCASGHVHQITWSNFNHGKRCPVCTKKRPMTIEEIRPLFEGEGYTLLNTIYKSGEKLNFACPEGHSGSIVWGSFQQGSRCSICSTPKGENHYLWNPDLTDEDREIAASRSTLYEFKKWRLLVFRRDDFTCQCCGYNKGGSIQAHHIYSYRSYPELALDVDNGVTLCEPCHLAFHRQHGFGSNNRSQYLEFLADQGKDF